MGVMGACRRDELYKMTLGNFRYLDSAVLVEIPNSKMKTRRKFTITGYFYEIIKKYANLRPKNTNHSFFFVNYQRGICTVQRVGINKFGSMGKTIASYLKLRNPASFTGHCFRKSSATVLVDAGEDMTALKRHGGWKSTILTEYYIDDSLKNKCYMTNKIVSSIDNSTNLLPTSGKSQITEYATSVTCKKTCPYSQKSYLIIILTLHLIYNKKREAYL